MCAAGAPGELSGCSLWLLTSGGEFKAHTGRGANLKKRQVWTLVVYGIFTELCNQHHNQCYSLCHPKKRPRAFQPHLPDYSSPPAPGNEQHSSSLNMFPIIWDSGYCQHFAVMGNYDSIPSLCVGSPTPPSDSPTPAELLQFTSVPRQRHLPQVMSPSHRTAPHPPANPSPCGHLGS